MIVVLILVALALFAAGGTVLATDFPADDPVVTCVESPVVPSGTAGGIGSAISCST